MSSLAERLRDRGVKKVYKYDDSDDELVPQKKPDAKAAEDGAPKRFTRTDAKDGACQACGENGSLISCGTCTYSFHLKCLLPPRRSTPDDSWSCPECVSPLTDVEKILDCEMRSTIGDGIDAAKPGSKQKYVKQYLVKWKGLSYLHCTWVPEKEFIKASKTNPRVKTRLNNFHKQVDSTEDDWVAIRPEWTTVDRIIATRKVNDDREYFVKWKELPYDECYWESASDISAFQYQIERFRTIQSRGRRKSAVKSKIPNRDSKELKHKQKYDHTPEFLSGGTLHPYQLEGLNFLRYSWAKQTHMILADEMGLGKTIQSIAFLASLFQENIYPHLVVAPLSTLRNWEREFATWAPEMNVVMYFGSAAARSVIRDHEFYYPKDKTMKVKKKKTSEDANLRKQSRIKFDVLLTSYEMITMDSTSLKPIQWQCMIVDEGHRLKNKDSKLFLQLKLYSTKHRVLLTGTPLQNNLDELFMLMHFLDDGKFASIEDFQKEFKDINQEEQVARLHTMLAPHLLRRVKKDVMKDLPPKKELILRVDLSTKQKEYYKAILTRNYQILTRRGGAQISLINVVMELRKLCCHAYMLEGVEPDVEPADASEGLRQLLDSSGKMLLLDKLMVKLKEQGHRVLIYSQFQHMLDLLEDYLSYKKWNYERIDGKISGAERQIRIDRFNAKNSTRFCFLLSTRAGGLGINLATADTVIIYDSDWNPHADLQAMARAHRLGQTNKVMIFRLITRGTIEERMMEMTKKKMILEHVVVGRLKAQMVNQEELDDIIRYGSKELFADEGDEAGKARQIHYDDAAIDRLLNRDQIGEEESAIDEDDDSFLKAFKVANFEYIDEVEAAAAKLEEAKKQSMLDNTSAANSDRAKYWDELLKDRYEVHQIDELTAMGKGKRSRKQMAAADEDDIPGGQDLSSEDEDYRYEDDSSDAETSLHGNGSGKRGQHARKKSRDYIESLPLMEGEGKSFRVLGFNQHQRAVFLQILMRYGFGKFDWKEFVPRLKGKSLQEIHEYGVLFMSHMQEEASDSLNFSDGVPKEGLRLDDVSLRIANIQLIEEKVEFASKNCGVALFDEDLLACFPGMKGKAWKYEHDVLLLKAILKHGYARWQTMVEDKDLGLADAVSQVLNLPFANGTAGVQMNDGASSSHSTNETVDANKGSQQNPDYSAQYQVRELQRRMVDFIKKRYLLLEKVLTAEYCLRETGYLAPPGSASQDPDVKCNGPGTSSSVPVGTNPLKELPILEPIALEEPAYDNQPERLEMARLYNRMCLVVEGSALDSTQTHQGDHFAGSRLSKNLSQIEPISEAMQRILTGQDQSLPATMSDVNINPSTESEIENREGMLPSNDGEDIKNVARAESSTQVHESQANKEISDTARELGQDKCSLQTGMPKPEDPTAPESKLNSSLNKGDNVEIAEASIDQPVDQVVDLDD